MNLTKLFKFSHCGKNLKELFNFSYLMQNIKKSKALIILMVALVPLFTSIVLISMTEEYVFSFIELSAVNLIGMYIIPVILSLALFGYVYKKNSVDFIGSMPISRRSIFTTNTIGGIAIIAIMQLLTMICTLFLSRVLSNVVVFGSMVWDIFIFYTIAYIFVFTVANLAMTISGNRISQIVITLLILFLIPFLVISGRLYYEESNTDWVDGRKAIEITQAYHFTAPSFVFETAIYGENLEYDQESMIKMLVLSLIYIGIGYYLFKKKKLEMAGEAFETKKIHLIVKLLTMLPFMAIFCALSDDDRGSVFLFFLAIVGVYYFVFDLITNKKIKLKTTIPAFFGSLAILFAFYEGIAPNFAWIPDVRIEKGDVQSIVIENIAFGSSNKKKFDLLIEDEAIVNLIMNNCLNLYNYSRSGYYPYAVDTEVYSSTVEITTEEVTEIIPKEVPKRPQFSTDLKLILKNGKQYDYSDYLTFETWNQILSKYGKQMVEQDFSKMKVVFRRLNLTQNEKSEIIEILNKTVSKLTYQQLYELCESKQTDYTLYLYEYENHHLQKRNYSQEIPNELFKKIITICNKNAPQNLDEIYRIYCNENELAEYLEEYIKEHYNEYEELSEYIEWNSESGYSINTKNMTDSELKAIQEKFPLIDVFNLIDNYGRYYDLCEEATDELKDFILQDYKNEVDINKKYIVLESSYPNYMWYYTNNLDAICKILIEKYFDIVEREDIKVTKTELID